MTVSRKAGKFIYRPQMLSDRPFRFLVGEICSCILKDLLNGHTDVRSGTQGYNAWLLRRLKIAHDRQASGLAAFQPHHITEVLNSQQDVVATASTQEFLLTLGSFQVESDKPKFTYPQAPSLHSGFHSPHHSLYRGDYPMARY